MVALFEKLKELQDIIHERFNLEHELEELPLNLSKKAEILSRFKKTLTETKMKLEELKKQRQNLYYELQDCSLRKENLEKQMDNVKTQKEYETLDKEIKDSGEKEQNLRRELNNIDREIDLNKEEEKKTESFIETIQEEFEEERQKMVALEKEMTGRIGELQNLEAQITPGLDTDMVFKFKRIIRSKQGIGIVAILNGVCTGCHMMLPMQFVNDVRKNERVMFCPYCSRVLYFESDQHEHRSEPLVAEAGGLADVLEEE